MHHVFGRLAILGALALVGCDGETTTKSTGGDTGSDTAVTDTGTDTGCATPLPILIGPVSVTCDASDMVTFDLSVDGAASGGLIFSQETGNTTPQFSDEHDLTATGTSECGTGSLGLTLATGGAGALNDNTVFSCADHHGSPQGVMSYIAVAFDDTGAQADCYAWGHNPQDAIDGTSDRVVAPTADLSNCAVDQGVY